MENLPYAQRTPTLKKMLEKIKTASVPEKFSPDFVSTKLSMRGGPPRSTIPFIKKMGLVASDGTPTSRYSEFRNTDKSGAAIADSMREVYEKLFEMNEYVYSLDSSSLKSLIVEATGADADSTAVAKTFSTFNFLNELADFEIGSNSPTVEPSDSNDNVETIAQISIPSGQPPSPGGPEGISLSYTINLNLPPTKDIEVFNAIFKSLKRHLLQD